MTKSKFQKSTHQGSALLIALIVIASIGGTALGLGRIALAEIGTTTNLQDALVALSTSQSGVEDGLLRWRFNNGVSIPAEPFATALDQPPLVYRTNLGQVTDITNGEFTYINSSVETNNQQGIDPNNLNYLVLKSSLDKIYDLRVYYLSKFIGSDVNGDQKLWNLGTGDILSSDTNADALSPQFTNVAVNKDQKIELDLNNLELDDFNMEVRWGAAGNVSTDMRALQLTLVSNSSTLPTKTLLAFDSSRTANQCIKGPDGQPATPGIELDQFTGSNIAEFANSIKAKFNAGASIPSRLIVTTLSQRVDNTTNCTADTSGGAPAALNAVVGFGVRQDVPGSYLGGPFHYIESTGYYHGVRVRQVATVDRNSATIIQLFTFVLYSGTTISF